MVLVWTMMEDTRQGQGNTKYCKFGLVRGIGRKAAK